jgi:UDPglucose 6-dehydrogenase
MIGIVGYGVIGKTTHNVLFHNEKIIVHDISLNTKISSLFNCELVFICIPTNNHLDILEIKNIIFTFNKANPKAEIVVRSTITPGFFNNISGNLTYLPEFLRERNAFEDAKNSNVMFYSSNLKESKLNLYNNFNFKLKRINFSELEILKLMSNNYYAMKVVFANHFYDLCKKYEANYNIVLNSFYESKNGQSYMEVNENLRGYGGKCLPKDIDFAIDVFSDCKLFQSIKDDNQKWKITVREDI